MENINLFNFNRIEIVLVAILFFLFLAQLFYYCFFYRRPFLFAKKQNNKYSAERYTPSVSIIITTNNNTEDLEKNLPAILNQDYPNYEVIIVNNGFTEETDSLIKRLKLHYPHLYDTFLPYEPLEKRTDRRKLALTIGIKAAKNDILLFTESDTSPVSNNWISCMMNSMGTNKDIVLGYCYYKRSKGLFSRMAVFDNLICGLQYLSSAMTGKPYIGTYRNVAYRKHLFFDNKGFSRFLNYDRSENIFLNYIMNAENVAVCVLEDSFTCTAINRFGKWKYIKTSFYNAKKYIRNFRFRSKLFCFESLSRYLFYLLFSFLLAYSVIHHKWDIGGIAMILFIIKIVTQLIMINKSSTYFKSGNYYFSFILMELLQPAYNFYFRNLKAAAGNNTGK